MVTTFYNQLTDKIYQTNNKLWANAYTTSKYIAMSLRELSPHLKLAFPGELPLRVCLFGMHKLYFKLPGPLKGLNDESNYTACPFVERIVKRNLNTTVITFLTSKNLKLVDQINNERRQLHQRNLLTHGHEINHHPEQFRFSRQ